MEFFFSLFTLNSLLILQDSLKDWHLAAICFFYYLNVFLLNSLPFSKSNNLSIWTIGCDMVESLALKASSVTNGVKTGLVLWQSGSLWRLGSLWSWVLSWSIWGLSLGGIFELPLLAVLIRSGCFGNSCIKGWNLCCCSTSCAKTHTSLNVEYRYSWTMLKY